jgi:hypothetical protein
MSGNSASVVDGETHRMRIDTVTTRKREVLMVTLATPPAGRATTSSAWVS